MNWYRLGIELEKTLQISINQEECIECEACETAYSKVFVVESGEKAKQSPKTLVSHGVHSRR